MSKPNEESQPLDRRLVEAQSKIQPLRVELIACKSPDRRKELRAEIARLRDEAVQA